MKGWAEVFMGKLGPRANKRPHRGAQDKTATLVGELLTDKDQEQIQIRAPHTHPFTPSLSCQWSEMLQHLKVAGGGGW